MNECCWGLEDSSSIRIAAAPRSIASSTNAWPLCLVPRMATNKSPCMISRESITAFFTLIALRRLDSIISSASDSEMKVPESCLSGFGIILPPSRTFTYFTRYFTIPYNFLGYFRKNGRSGQSSQAVIFAWIAEPH